MISFAGVSLPLPTAELMQKLAPFPVESLRPWAWRDSYAVPKGIPPFDAPEPIEPEINVLEWPTQPTRWAYGHFLCSGSQLTAIRQAISTESGGYGDLVFDDGGLQQSFRMKLVHAYPLFQVATTSTTTTTTSTSSTSTTTTCPVEVKDEDLYLITLVDRRYWWWYKPIQDTNPFDTCDWTTLFQNVLGILGISPGNYTIEPIPPQYLKPSARWNLQNWDGYPACLYLESAARFVGARVVCRTDGTIVVQRPGKKSADVTQFDTDDVKRSKFLLGGKIPEADAIAAMPENVRVVFYDKGQSDCDKVNLSINIPLHGFQAILSHDSATTTTMDCTTSSTSTSTTTTTSLPFCVNSDIIVPHTYAVVWADTDSQDVNLQDYAQQVANDWYLWRIPSVSAIFAGVVDWVLSGLTDRLEVRHTHLDFDTRVLPIFVGLDNLIAPGLPCNNTACSTPDTPTTNPTCAGECVWTFTAGEWVKTSGTCQCPCECAPPSRCPDGSVACAVVRTSCVIFPTSCKPSPVICGTTTTGSTTTTTLPVTCGGSCEWYMDASGGLYRFFSGTNTYKKVGTFVGENYCDNVTSDMPVTDGSCGMCETPQFPDISPCHHASTPCSVPTTSTCPNVGCGGSCVWNWDDTLAMWVKTAGCIGSNCDCDPPAGTGAGCNSVSASPCYDHSNGGGCGCGPVVTTVPDSPCGVDCLWQWNGTNWAIKSGTCNIGCSCQPPTNPGGGTCDVIWTPCNPDQSTTTSSTTTSTTTTTNPCIGLCNLHCFCSNADGTPNLTGGHYTCILTSSANDSTAGCACPSAQCTDGVVCITGFSDTGGTDCLAVSEWLTLSNCEALPAIILGDGTDSLAPLNKNVACVTGGGVVPASHTFVCDWCPYGGTTTTFSTTTTTTTTTGDGSTTTSLDT